VTPNVLPAPTAWGCASPTIIVSPWTRGGWVNSQLFDHASLIRFLEARFAGNNPDLVESNIIVRAVMGHESTSATLNLYTHAPSEFEDRVRGVFDDPDDDSLTE